MKSPTPEEIKRVRKRAGLTQLQAGKLVGVRAQSRWAEYENGTYKMQPYRWELFLIKLRSASRRPNAKLSE